MSRDPRLDAYIADAEPFAQPILQRARDLVHALCPEVEEAMKWSSPTFVYRGKILCGMAAFTQHASFGFWQHEKVMGEDIERVGMGSFGKMTSVRDLPSKTTLAPLVKKAMQLIDDGVSSAGVRKRNAPKPPPTAPDDLLAALKKNAAARRTFEAFSPSHRREYVEWITEARREETRARRLAQAIEWLAEGKPRNWKYLG